METFSDVLEVARAIQGLTEMAESIGWWLFWGLIINGILS